MSKIESVSGNFFSKEQKKKKVTQKESEKVRTFAAIFETEGSEPSVEGIVSLESFEGGDLESLLDAVHERGDRIKDKPSMENIKAYRRAVRAFLQFALRDMADVEEKVSGGNILKRKRFTLIRVIDEKLDRLVRAVLQGQASQLDTLARVNEINGLIVDLVQ
jgi:uncharacterized protein YaaR (DUF327 family)